MEDNELKPIASLFHEYEIPPKKARATERGELLKFFSEKMSRSIPFMAKRLAHLDIPDLYYLQSVCISYEREGKEFGKAFNGSLKVRK